MTWSSRNVVLPFLALVFLLKCFYWSVNSKWYVKGILLNVVHGHVKKANKNI